MYKFQDGLQCTMRVLTTLLTMLKRNCSISNDYIRWVVAVYGFDVVDLRYAMK